MPEVVADLLHEAEVGLVVHLLVALVAVGLVVLVLLLGYALRPQQPLQVRALRLHAAQPPVLLLQLAQLLDLQQVVPPRADHRHELLGASGGWAGGERPRLYFGQTYIYSAVLEHLIISESRESIEHTGLRARFLVEQQPLGPELLFGRDVEVEVDEFEQAPLDVGADVREDLVVHVLAVLGQDVPGAPDDLAALRYAGRVLHPPQDLLEDAEVQHPHLAVVLGDDLVREAALDGGLGLPFLAQLLLGHHVLDGGDVVHRGLL